MESPDFQKMNLCELKAFLKGHGARLTGNKEDLVKRCRDYFNVKGLQDSNLSDKVHEKSSKILVELERNRKLFDLPKLWSDISKLEKKSIPASFDIEEITSFLATSLDVFDDDDNNISSATKKPYKKGKAMYNSGKIESCQLATKST